MNDAKAVDADLMWSLIHTARSLEKQLEDALGVVGLSVAKHGVLSQLARAAEPLTLSELAARVACVRSNITQLVDRLEQDGLVRREDDPADRRSIRAVLTVAGRERYEAGEKELAVVHETFSAALSGGDRSALDKALERLG